MDGLMDEVAIWDTALTSEEIKTLYETQKGQWLDENLVAYYKFNEVNDAIVPDPARGQSGELLGNASLNGYGLWDSNALTLDGSGDYVRVNSDVFAFAEDFSTSFWFTYDATPGTYARLIDYSLYPGDRGWFIGYYNTTKGVEFRIENGGSDGDIVIPAANFTGGGWHQITTTYDYSTRTGTIYLNGQEIDSAAGTIDIDYTSVNYLGIGARLNSSPVEYIAGLIDEVKFYDKVLTQEEITTDYNSFFDSKLVSSNIIDSGATADWNTIKINSDLYYDFGTQLEDHVSGTALTNQLESTNPLFDENLIGLWHLNNDANDYSGNDNNGTWTAGETYNNGLWDTNAGVFDDTGSHHIQVADFVETPQMTFNFWMYLEDGGTVFMNKDLWSHAWGYQIYIPSGADDLSIRGSGSTTKTFSDIFLNDFNKWLNVTIVFDDATVKVYKDGIYYDEGTINSLVDVNHIMCIGGYGATCVSYPFVGKLEEIGIWNKSLNANEVSNLYLSQAGQFDEPNIIGLWHLNESSGDAIDSSGHGMDGTVTAAQGASGLWDTNTYTFGLNQKINILHDSLYDFGTGDSFTFSTWINPTVVPIGTWDGIFYHGIGAENQIHVGLSSYGTIGAGTGNGSSWQSHQSDFKLPANKWTHVVVVMNRNTNEMHIYGNGILQNTYAHSQVPSATIADIDIGLGAVASEYFNGKIEDVTLWNVPLSTKQIQDLYRKGTSSLDLNIYTCTTSACITKEDFNYIPDANNNSWMSISGLSSRYLGYDAYFKQPTDFANNNAGFFHTGAFLTDVNIEAGGVATYVNTGYADANFAPGASTFIGITDNNTIPSGGSIDYNVQFDGNGQWFTNPDYNIGFDYNLILRTILTNGTSSPNLLDVNINYEQTN
jgi:hypothetical protein